MGYVMFVDPGDDKVAERNEYAFRLSWCLILVAAIASVLSGRADILVVPVFMMPFVFSATLDKDRRKQRLTLAAFGFLLPAIYAAAYYVASGYHS